jgi:peptidyl-tRNA hydrolase
VAPPAVPDGTPLILLSPLVEMSAGKAMAQAAHAAQLGWRSLRRRPRRRWQEAGFPLAVRPAGERQWRAALNSGAPVVHDGGFTEVAPGTATAAFVPG